MSQPVGTSILKSVGKASDLVMAFAVIAIIMMMIFPLPTILLDFLLATSLSIAVIILMMSIYIARPLDFGVFPTVLLITTLLRLALNIATTRNILLNGASGDVSILVAGFGKIVIGGNIVVGLVVFIILMIINFIVITKGAGRVAEVAARFTLDAMPGKQMAIDAELNAGHINVEEAKRRRSAVEREADFYGAMDGASKFVRGDAIAAIIITVVNLVVGLIVGVFMYNMSVSQATSKFLLLAVGDGLISAIPALMVSTASGIIITRITSAGNLGEEVLSQVREHSKAFYIAAGLIFTLSLIPSFPKLSFWVLAVFLIMIGRFSDAWKKDIANTEEEKKKVQEKSVQNDAKTQLDLTLKVDMLALEVGHGLISVIDPSQDGEVVDRIQGIRKQFAQELGIVVPQIQLRDNLQLGPSTYAIMLKGTKVAHGTLMPDYFLAMDPGTVELPLNGEPTKDPVYGLPAIWVHKREKEDAVFRGYTVVNCATIMATHITKVLKERAPELVTRQEVHQLIEKLKETNPKVVEEVIAQDRLSVGEVLRVVQNLLSEEVSIRDILSLFECLADHCKMVKNPDVLAEYCRKSIGRHIVQRLMGEQEELSVVTFDRLVEDILASGLVVTENGSSYLNLDAKQAQDILQKVMSKLTVFEEEGTQPILLISARLRKAFQLLISRYVNQLVVLSYDEIPPEVQIKNLGMIS